jgi:hypothetical protein
MVLNYPGAKYQVGDWVILRERYLTMLSKMNFEQAKITLEKYKHPNKILSIFEYKLKDGTVHYGYSTGGKTAMKEKEFRLATNKEIKEQELRNIFI